VQQPTSPPPEDHHHARGEIAITTLATVKTARRLARRRTRLPGERSSKTMPSGQFHHPARRIFSRSRSAFVSVAFITERVTCPAHLKDGTDEALDAEPRVLPAGVSHARQDRKSTRLNSSHGSSSY